MLFDPFVALFLFLAVLIVNSAIQDGKTNWLEGYLLMCVYVSSNTHTCSLETSLTLSICLRTDHRRIDILVRQHGPQQPFPRQHVHVRVTSLLPELCYPSVVVCQLA